MRNSRSTRQGMQFWGLLVLIVIILSCGPQNNSPREGPPVGPPLATFDLGEFMVTLKGGKHQLRVTFKLAYVQRNKRLAPELVKRKAQLRDRVITLLAAKTRADLTPTRAKKNLKLEIKEALNTLLLDGKIADIYYEEFSLY